MTMIMTGVANTGGRIAFLEPVGKVLGLDEEAERAFGSEGYLPHCLSSRVRGHSSTA
jgi:hypothetical protein